MSTGATKSAAQNKATIAFLKAFEASISQSDSTQQVADEINNLAKEALQVQKDINDKKRVFANILNHLTRDTPLKTDVTKVSNEWDAIAQQYTDVLWNSRRVAGSAEGAANDFIGDFMTFLTDSSVPLEEKQSEIKNYLENLEKDGQDGQTMLQSFDDLRGSAQSVLDEWDSVVKQYRLDRRLQIIKEYKAQIAELNIKLNALLEKIKEHVASGGSMSGALGVLAPLCPTLVANALQAAVQSSSGDEDAELAKLIHEYLETRDTIQRKTYKLHHLEQSITEIETLQSSLELTVQELSDLSKRLSAITNVWPMLRADLEFISQLLPFAGTSDFDKFFQLHLRTLTSIYTVIAAALRQYQIAVNPEDPSFKNVKKV